MQSLSEDSMICWAAQYFRNRWLQDGEYEDYMMKAGMEEAFYWWWNDDKEKTQQVLQRQKTYADEVRARTTALQQTAAKIVKKTKYTCLWTTIL